jgi:hypothetical protein
MTTVDGGEDRDGRCGARKRQGFGNCTQRAGWGTSHPGSGPCKLHGGATSAHVRKAERERAEAAVLTFGLRREGVLPEQILLEETQWTAGHVAWLRAEVQQLERQELTWGRAEMKDGVVTYKAGEPVIVKLFVQQQRHLMLVAKAAADAGVSERLVKLAEAQGQLLAEGLRWLVLTVAEQWPSPELGVLLRDTSKLMLAHLAAGAVPVVEGDWAAADVSTIEGAT